MSGKLALQLQLSHDVSKRIVLHVEARAAREARRISALPSLAATLALAKTSKKPARIKVEDEYGCRRNSIFDKLAFSGMCLGFS